MPDGIYLLIGLGIGGLLGWLVGFLQNKRAASPLDNRLENELRSQLQQREKELSQTRDQLSANAAALATAEANRDATQRMLAEAKFTYAENLQAAKLAQDKALADLRDTFKALSADALKQSAPEFLRLAEQSFGKFQETAKGDLDKRQESIKVLVEPLKQQLETYQKRL
ncbi:MAG: DNA recombination protein RmuC, partial [Verrucomicrobiota bacterium]